MSLISACLLGFYDVAKKQALKRNGVLEVLTVATAISALLLSPFITAGTLPDHLKLIAKAVIVSSSWVSGLAAIKLIPLTTVSTIKATRPVLVVLLSIVLFGERMNLMQWAGVVLVIGSLWFLSRSSRSEGIDFRSNRGIAYMVVSVLTGAGSALWDKHIMRGMEPLFVQSWANVYITLVLLAVIVLHRKLGRGEAQPFRWDWMLLVIALFITAADALYFFAIKEEGSMLSIISLIRRSSVVITFVAGALLYREHNVRSKAAVLAVLMCGIALLMFGS